MDLQSAAVFPDVLYVAITYFMRYLSRSTGGYGVIGHLSTFTAVCIKLDSASTRRKKKKIFSLYKPSIRVPNAKINIY